MDLQQIKDLIEDQQVEAIDLKYADLAGHWYHITFPARRLDYVLENGIPFDGSSIPGMRQVESGDLVLMPDLTTAQLDPFASAITLRMICSISDADTRIGVKKDPRSVAKRALEFLQASGLADEALFIPELEFYLFDEAEYHTDKFGSFFHVASTQNKNCLPDGYDDTPATSQNFRKGYHMDTPFDRFYHVRQEMVEIMEQLGIKVRYHHHEVGLAAQQEIETELLPFPAICDDVMLMKDAIRQTALENDLTATFMPKPIFNEAGNGMHFHILFRKNGRNVWYKEGNYANLSQEALYFIGGILKHGASLSAFTNPSTNSYKRLLPGFEAPVKLFFGLANRSAAIRIPKYATKEENKRFEYRTGDATANPYLAMSALIMAGMDGIAKKIDPREHNFGPFDDNVFNWSEEKKATLSSVPESLSLALKSLQEDHDYLLKGDVFSQELIQGWITLKNQEAELVNQRPVPIEFDLYYNL